MVEMGGVFLRDCWRACHASAQQRRQGDAVTKNAGTRAYPEHLAALDTQALERRIGCDAGAEQRSHSRKVSLRERFRNMRKMLHFSNRGTMHSRTLTTK